jgi:hypothetical protein
MTAGKRYSSSVGITPAPLLVRQVRIQEVWIWRFKLFAVAGAGRGKRRAKFSLIALWVARTNRTQSLVVRKATAGTSISVTNTHAQKDRARTSTDITT